MTNLQAAIGLAQLENIDKHIQKKRQIGEMYQDLLSNLKGFQLPLKKTNFSDNIYWVFGLVAESEELYRKALSQLESEGIGTRPFFWCMHKQPVFQKMKIFDNTIYPVAERLSTNGFYLPSGLGLTHEEIKIVSKSINKI
jgi:perosamine synthetase